MGSHGMSRDVMPKLTMGRPEKGELKLQTKEQSGGEESWAYGSAIILFLATRLRIPGWPPRKHLNQCLEIYWILGIIHTLL